jgi:hypothetical protein
MRRITMLLLRALQIQLSTMSLVARFTAASLEGHDGIQLDLQCFVVLRVLVRQILLKLLLELNESSDKFK